jgi:hypothetical protein
MKGMKDKEDIYKEVLIALSYFDEELIQKIPIKVFDKLKELASNSELEVHIDTKKDLQSQNISEQSKDMISLIYYICAADEGEKKEIFTMWRKNDESFKH